MSDQVSKEGAERPREVLRIDLNGATFYAVAADERAQAMADARAQAVAELNDRLERAESRAEQAEAALREVWKYDTYMCQVCKGDHAGAGRDGEGTLYDGVYHYADCIVPALTPSEEQTEQ